MTTLNPVRNTGITGIAITLVTALITTTTLPVSSASAHDRFGKRHYHERHSDYHDHRRHGHRKHYKKRRNRNNDGDLVAAGILGLAIGVILSEGTKRQRNDRRYYDDGRRPLNHVNQNQYHRYEDYQDDAPIRRRDSDTYGGNGNPEVITYEGSVVEPWTVDWYRYCETKYRSFDAKTGTFTGYDGKKRFCVPK